MKISILLLTLSLTFSAFAEEAAKNALNSTCPISGKAANPAITSVYENKTYAFHDEASRSKFQTDRKASIYDQIGGQAAMTAAVDLFYVKVLADPRVNFFFEEVNMAKQKRLQNEFLSSVLGSPAPYTGKDMRKAHADLDLNEVHFQAIAEHLLATLQELKVPEPLINQIMTLVASTKNAILNRPEKAKS